MQKIAIATPVDMNNFGNRLQNYAVHSICNKMDLEARTIDFPKKYYGISVNSMIRAMSPFCFLPIVNQIPAAKKFQKLVRGYQFSRNHMKFFESSSKNKINRFIDKCDFFGIGGDQIWSAYWADYIWYCGFEGQNPSKKICFAPSFGKSHFSDQEEQIVRRKILNIDFPAVREFSGLELFKKLTGRGGGTQIIDPVLMIDKEEWCSIMSASKKPDEGKYVLLYFLGADHEQKDKAISLAKENGLTIIDIMDVKSKYYGIGPDDFLSLVNDAECVFTDSYHGILMCMILKTAFVICQRKAENGGSGMNTRIETIASLFDINSRMYAAMESTKFNDLFKIKDYDEVIDNYQKRAWEYYSSFVKHGNSE